MSVPCRKLRRGSVALWRHRQAKRAHRNRKKCAKIGHQWFWTCGATSISGKTVQWDKGQICRRCGRYEELETWKESA